MSNSLFDSQISESPLINSKIKYNLNDKNEF